MVREATIQKVNRIEKLLRDNKGDLSVKAACKRVGLSEAWFYKIRNQIRSANEAN